MKSTWFLADIGRQLRVVLASESPRRFELLKQVGIDPIVEPSDFDEVFEEKLAPSEFVQRCALEKAKRVRERLISEKKPFDVIIGSDTIIELDGQILGKAKDDTQAFEFLKRMSGRTQRCLTGVALLSADKDKVFLEGTEILFRPLHDEVIKRYVETGEYKGCAGAYRIQGRAAVFVDRIDGCFNNIVGLPVSRVCAELQTFLS